MYKGPKSTRLFKIRRFSLYISQVGISTQGVIFELEFELELDISTRKSGECQIFGDEVCSSCLSDLCPSIAMLGFRFRTKKLLFCCFLGILSVLTVPTGCSGLSCQNRYPEYFDKIDPK